MGSGASKNNSLPDEKQPKGKYLDSSTSKSDVDNVTAVNSVQNEYVEKRNAPELPLSDSSKCKNGAEMECDPTSDEEDFRRNDDIYDVNNKEEGKSTEVEDEVGLEKIVDEDDSFEHRNKDCGSERYDSYDQGEDGGFDYNYRYREEEDPDFNQDGSRSGSPFDEATSDMFAFTAMSLGMNNEDMLFNMMYFGGSESTTTDNMRTSINATMEEAVAAHSANNTPYKLRPATEGAIAELEIVNFSKKLMYDDATGDGGTNVDAVSDCMVCREELEHNCEVIRLPECKHSFHADCITRWLSLQGWCPVCRCAVELPTAAADGSLDREKDPADGPTRENTTGSSTQTSTSQSTRYQSPRYTHECPEGSTRPQDMKPSPISPTEKSVY